VDPIVPPVLLTTQIIARFSGNSFSMPTLSAQPV
jgi:hypothetical protein